MKNKSLPTLLTIALSMLLLVSLAACGGTDAPDPEDSLTPDTMLSTEISEMPTEVPTEAPTEIPTEAFTEAPTEAPEETTVNPDEIDPEDPVYNLIQVGLSGDGETPCYDGRYVMEYDCFYNELGLSSGSIQEVFDDLEGYGGYVAMNNYDDIGYCFYVDVPDDGNLYVMYYNWANCDFRFSYGVTYDDRVTVDADGWLTHGYAYYSDLKTLDDMSGLNDSVIYIWDITYGLAPGVYSMTEEPSGELNYTYTRIGDLEEYWPGLPTNHNEE